MATTTSPRTSTSVSAGSRRWGPLAVAATVAPVTEAVASALHPEMPADYHDLLPLVAETDRWYVMSLVALAACCFSLAAFAWLNRAAQPGAPRLAVVGVVIASAAAVLMGAMQGFKLFLPTLAEVSPARGATAVGDFVDSAAFAPMIAAFLLRAIGWATLAVAVGRATRRWWGPGIIVAGVVAAFLLPAGPDAAAWLAVAAGVAVTVGTAPGGRPASAAGFGGVLDP